VADRSIVVKLRAEVDGYKRAMAEATKATEAVGDKAEKTAVKATTGLGRMVESASKHDQAWTQVGTSLLTVGTLAAVGVGAAVSSFADFDAQMSKVQASTHETASNMGLLREEALKAGAATKFSATEAAAGIDELAKAGVSTKDILNGGLAGALDLAAAGNLDVAEAAETAASAMTQFGLSGEDVPHIADLLAAAAGKAQGSVSDMGAALNQAGLVADATGLSIEETTAGLAAFASAGLVGSDAGTSFKSMLQRLTPQSAEAQRAMDELGISAYDAQGNFIGLDAFAGNLETAMADLTPQARNAAMAVIFGSDAVRAANVLYEQGASGIESWTERVNDSGYAAETAALMTNNLQGDLERLGGSFDTALIQSGSAGNGVLRELVQTATGALDIFNGLPQGLQSTALGIGAVVAAAALATGGFLVLAPRIVETRKATAQLKADMPGLAGGMNKLAAATSAAVGIAATAAAVSSLVEALTQGDAEQGANAITRGLEEMAAGGGFAVSQLDAQFQDFGTFLGMPVSRVNDLSDALAQIGGNKNGVDRVTDSFASFLGQMPGITSYTEKVEERFKGVDSALSAMVAGGSVDQAREAFHQIAEQAEAQGVSVEELTALFPEYSDALIGAEDAQAASAEATEATTTAVEDQSAALEELIGLQAEAAGVVLSERDAQRELEAAYDAVTASVEQQIAQLASQYEAQGMTTDAARAQAEAEVAVSNKLDITTEAGRRNQAALDDIASSTFDLIESMQENGATQEDLQGTMAASRDRFLEAAGALGLGAEEANALADELGLIPKNVDVAVGVDVNTGAASAAIDAFVARENARGRSIRIQTIIANGGNTGAGLATGGPVFGPGTETSDSIAARLSNNEHVWTAAEVKGAGGHASVARIRAAARAGSLRSGVPGFAHGGSPAFMSAGPAPAMSLEGMRIAGTLTMDGLPVVIDAVVTERLSERSADASGRRRTERWGR
jgi:TP901 family phage tail tape measure protein